MSRSPDPRPQTGSLRSRDFLLLLAGVHIYFITFYGLFPIIPAFMEGHSGWAVGAVVGAFGVGSMITRLWSGSLSDRLGRRAVIAVGLIASTFALAAFTLGPDPLVLLPPRLVYGMAFVMVATPTIALVGDLIPEGRRAMAMAFMWVASESPPIYAPAVAERIVDRYGFSAVFLVMASLAVVALVLLVRIAEPSRPPGGRVLQGLPSPIAISRGSLVPMAGFLGATTAFGTFQAFVGGILSDRDLGGSGVFFVPFGLLTVATVFLSAPASERVGHIPVAVTSVLAVAASLILVAVAQSPALVVVGGALFGTGLGSSFTSLSAHNIDTADPADRGKATGTMNLAWDLGIASALISGGIAEIVGMSALLTLNAALTVGMAVLLLLARPSRRRPVAFAART